MNSIGLPPVSDESLSCISEGGRERSRTWVAPSDLSQSSCLRDDVVMMGEKPFRRAHWMTGKRGIVSHRAWKGTRRATRRTELADGRRPSKDEGRLASVLVGTAFFPWRSEASRLCAFSKCPERGDSRRECERNRRCLVKGDIGRDLIPCSLNC